MSNDLTARPGFLALVPGNMHEAIELANFMATARTLPVCLQNSPGDCLMVIEQAMRWHMSPFAVAQCTSSIKGKLMYEGKLVAAAIEGSGAIQGNLDYRFSGEEGTDERTVTVSAMRTGEHKPREFSVMLKNARTSNEWWSKQPDQQLVYFATRAWARRWTPAVILGVYSPEDMAKESYAGTTIEGVAEVVQEAPEASHEEVAKPARKAQDIKKAEKIIDGGTKPNGNGNWDRWLDKLQTELDKLQTPQDWDALWGRATIKNAEGKMPDTYLPRLDAMRVAAMHRVFPVPPPPETAPETPAQ
jgi:hypothetical protein